MQVYVAESYADMSRKAANILSAQVILKPDTVMGLATGSSPVGTYQQLIEWYKKGDLDFTQSYRRCMQENFFDHINIPRENTHVPNGLAPDLEAECRRYNQVIQSLGGIDIQLLGMGHNGHIGFNEPGQAFELETHVVDLTDNTIEANARFFASRDEVPRQAITMGIKSIMQAQRIVMVVSGADKADIVRAAFAGPVVPQVPASILQMHPNFILVGDKAALSKLG